MSLRIDFVRGRNGKVASAACSTPTGEISVSGITVRRAGKPTTGGDGVIYKALVALADAGYSGEAFDAHDGRLVCLEGVIDKLDIPVRYGGLKRDPDS